MAKKINHIHTGMGKNAKPLADNCDWLNDLLLSWR